MELKDIVQGKYYVINLIGGNKGIFKSKCSNTLQYTNIIFTATNNFYKNGELDYRNVTSNTLKLADNTQENWLNASVKANKFIPQDQIPNNELLIQNLIIW